MTEKKMPLEVADKLTELSLNLDKVSLMILNVSEFFAKDDAPTEHDLMMIKNQFGNIQTMIEIAQDYMISSRETLAEIQGTDPANIVG